MEPTSNLNLEFYGLRFSSIFSCLPKSILLKKFPFTWTKFLELLPYVLLCLHHCAPTPAPHTQTHQLGTRTTAWDHLACPWAGAAPSRLKLLTGSPGIPSPCGLEVGDMLQQNLAKVQTVFFPFAFPPF